ncbi:MAG: hypothetical protein SFV81_11680 [Pirellulaceae bacterium]|nr:hypothetical protein [Pirellulaceae bacterium]
MPQLQCPACQKVFKVKEEWAGKRVKCPCGNQLVVPNSDAGDAPTPTPTPKAPAAPAPARVSTPAPAPAPAPVAMHDPFAVPAIAPSNTVGGFNPLVANATADAFNPYAPSPSAMSSAVPAEGDEATRKAHLSHEASIKSIGVLYLLGAIIGFLLTVVYLVGGVAAFVTPSRNPGEGALAGAVLIVVGILAGAFATVQFILAQGLRSLKPWSRIGGVVLSCIGLLGFPIGTLISAYFLYLLASQKGVYIFSPEYARVIAATPHIKYKTSIIVWILLGILVFFIGLGIIGFMVAVIGGRR